MTSSMDSNLLGDFLKPTGSEPTWDSIKGDEERIGAEETLDLELEAMTIGNLTP